MLHLKLFQKSTFCFFTNKTIVILYLADPTHMYIALSLVSTSLYDIEINWALGYLLYNWGTL